AGPDDFIPKEVLVGALLLGLAISIHEPVNRERFHRLNVSCGVCRAGENGRGFHTLFENEIAEGRLQKRHSNKQIPPEECQIISSRKNIRSYPEIAEEEAIWRQ
ncbi:unnamed protein product, partial [Porites evermanni]